MKFVIPHQGKDFLAVATQTRSTWVFRLATLTTICQCLLGLAGIAWFWRSLPPAIPFWYSRPWGEDRLAPPGFLFLLLAAAIIIYATNVVVAARVGNEHPMFARVLLLTATLVSTLSFIIVIRILTLVA